MILGMIKRDAFLLPNLFFSLSFSSLSLLFTFFLLPSFQVPHFYLRFFFPLFFRLLLSSFSIFSHFLNPFESLIFLFISYIFLFPFFSVLLSLLRNKRLENNGRFLGAEMPHSFRVYLQEERGLRDRSLISR